jgi:hypothetical protein
LIAASAAAGAAAAGACSRESRPFERGADEIRQDPLQARSNPALPDLPVGGCADSVIGTARIRETAAVAPEGFRRRPMPQDSGWIPGRLADLAASPGRFAVVDQGGGSLTIFTADYTSRIHRERPGGGPGEFRSAVAVALGSGAEPVWVLDDRRRAAMAFSATAEYIREVAVRPMAGDLAVGADGTIYVAHRVPSGEAVRRGGDSVLVVSRYGRDGGPQLPLVALHHDALVPPRFVLPAVTEVGLAAAGQRVAVFYPAGGVIDVFEAGRHRAAARVCMPADLADAYARQRQRGGPQQSWVALVTDVRLEPDGSFSAVSSRRDPRGRFLIHRFRPDGTPAGTLVIENPGIAMPSEVRFGPEPNHLVAFSPATGIIASFSVLPG